jgi:pheromone shutdown protein TraB
MYNITLIGTIHSENGKCNSDELHKIIASINPEVIFDELTSNFCEMYYSDSFDMYCAKSILLNRHPPVVPLEVKCIKKYKQNYDIKIFPVDIDLSQKLSKYQQEIYFMISTFLKYEDYRNLDNEKETLIAQEGFHFLNSNIFIDYLERKEVIEKNIIESEFHKNRLFDIYKIFHAEQYDNRENAMLQNIYNYSKVIEYKQAVFLIGAEHKKSIMQKITEYEKLSEIKLNWTMYSNK